MRRLLAIAIAAGLSASACSSNDIRSGPGPTLATPDPSSSTGATESGSSTSEPASGAGPADPGDVSPPGDLADASVRFEEIAVLDEPLAMTTVAGDPHLWIAGRQGRIVRLDPASGEVANVVLDLGSDTVGRSERGLLGIATDTSHLYVDYTDPSGDTHVDSYELVEGGVDVDTRRELLFQTQPFGNHNGGGLAVDAEGHLYVAFGDGGSGGDPLDSGQDPFTWLGSILRIDPTPRAVEPYAIPADNPYAGGVSGRPEIYLTGVRNPWRFSFDAATGDLWVGDVGQNSFEEITVLRTADGAGLGANLGWNRREGFHEFTGPEPEGHVNPVYEYGRGDGVSVTGGYVYRGDAIPELYGNYVFGDFSTARLWALGTGTGSVEFRDLDAPVPGGNLASFGEGPDGELYALSLAGPISRIVPG